MSVSEAHDYPWYAAVSGNTLEQGDILLGCPVLQIPPEALRVDMTEIEVEVFHRNVIVM